MGWLRRLFARANGKETRMFQFTFGKVERSGDGDLPEGIEVAHAARTSIEGDFVVVRIDLPAGIDRSTVKLEPHGRSVEVSARGRTPDGDELHISERLIVSNADESAAQLDWEGDRLVIRMPRI